ncbi:MAG: rhomboid family intramembrane serine protease [Flavobacteriaceae bacterium]|nr:MAG: rhomboid family intramembrane serine protease [Flavobacteriaceae bacterium]
MSRVTDVIKHLIIINVILYLAPQFLDFDLQNLFALHFPESEEFGFWQFLTHMFMHSQQSFMHIMFNMYGLWAFGTPLERMWGKSKFIFFYFSAGLGAGLIYTAVNYYQFNAAFDNLIKFGLSSNEISQIFNLPLPKSNEGFVQSILQITQYNPNIEQITIQIINDSSTAYNNFNTRAVGASGAIYGILVAYGIAYPNAKLALMFFPFPIAAKYFIPLMIAGDLFFGVTKYSVGNVAHFAHIGGAIIGFIIAWYWKQNQFKQFN